MSRRVLSEAKRVEVEQALARGRSVEWMLRNLRVTAGEVGWVERYLEAVNDAPTKEQPQRPVDDRRVIGAVPPVARIEQRRTPKGRVWSANPNRRRSGGEPNPDRVARVLDGQQPDALNSADLRSCIAALVRSGMSSSRIAVLLGVSSRTVIRHRRQIRHEDQGVA